MIQKEKKKSPALLEKKIGQEILEAQRTELIKMFTASLPPYLSEEEIINVIIMQRNLLYAIQAGDMATFAS